MKLKVCLHEILKSKVKPGLGAREGKVELKLHPGSRVQDLLHALELPEEIIGLILVNGRQAGHAKVLENGDEISLFSIMAGG